ncbi:MAG TPA: hypothetical protein VE967_15925 [Gemmatimonadaceae bacterium]|nr:hypothetical protein [Gemmatimonadaceae bacterium]
MRRNYGGEKRRKETDRLQKRAEKLQRRRDAAEDAKRADAAGAQQADGATEDTSGQPPDA